MSINFLKLLHLADSAFPIGTSSHSFGIETLTAEGPIGAPDIEPFLREFLWENGEMEARFVRLAHRCHTNCSIHMNHPMADDTAATARWLTLNRAIAATKSARESRTASATLGRRFLQLVAHLEDDATLQQHYRVALTAAVDIHYCAAFGLVGGHLVVDEEATVLAYLQQSAMGLVSACVRLLPIGQGRASEILWRVKPLITQVAAASRAHLPVPADAQEDQLDWQRMLAESSCFMPLVDLGSMRHPTLPTRLFIS